MALPEFHRLRVREVRAETDESVSVAFEVPERLRPAYRFVQGQFLTLRESIEGEELRRSYSVCVGVPDYDATGELRVAIKRVTGGRFSNWANEHLHAGREIDVMTPDGRFFTPLAPHQAKHYVGFAGGSGITPMISLIRTILATEQGSEFTLIYGNRTVASIMFVEALEELKNRHMNRLRLVHVLSDEGQEIELFSGLLDDERCADLLRTVVPAATIDEAFICGPAPMMDSVERSLLAAGLAPAKIHVERFGTPAAPPAPEAPDIDDTTGAEVLLVVDGKERRLRVPLQGTAILDAGLRAGLNLPFACKAGVCCTCRARVLEGEVRMDRNFSLEDPEVARGFVLTCQAHPVSGRVVISFDER
ncbi:MAG TPA: phenylacetate-CoA oxygenase/reductase subunit PaaK [Burkholderiaceae bacterium]|jgi:ring-1,2-phenylacetyl-CoA epoxidase subunit PaaE|nr:phenylacetate-CoA oxygenase/reductase subunit PaaK [Burkholderiaceae bacterium]